MAERDPNLVKYEKAAFIAVFALFIAFFIATVLIGGDALNGYVEDGVHYVSSHGRDTPVSALTYYFSATLGSVALGSMVLLFIYKLVTNLIRKTNSRTE